MSTATVEQPLSSTIQLLPTTTLDRPPRVGSSPVPAGRLDQPLPGVAPLRLLPVPICDPPYDDERDGDPLPLRAVGSTRPRLHLVPAAVPDISAAAAGLPPAAPFARSLVQRLLEVIAGVRPLAHLQRDTSLEVYANLERLVQERPRRTGVRPDGRAVRSVHAQLRADGLTAEVSATVHRNGRYGAVALRLEGADSRWTCTELAGA